LNYNKKIGLLIIVSSVLRLLVAGSLELGNDEVYYQTYAQHLQWNYFDHPPMVALLIRLSTFNLLFQHEIFIRLGSILCAAAGTFLIFKIGTLVKNMQTGWIAAILYNTSFYSSVIAGTFILPDSPQVIFWLLSMYFMILILEVRVNDQRRFLLFVLLGISIGICIMSKLHAVFLWLGFGGYIIFHRRDLLKNPMLWISLLISITIASPIYEWNLENHFITYNYHQGRISFWGTKPDFDHFIQQLFGSLFYSNPVNFIIYVLTLFAFIRGKVRKVPVIYPLFLWLSFPLIGVLLLVSLFSETLPHWSGPAYLSLMILAASWLEEQAGQITRKWILSAIWLYSIVLLIGVIGILYLPFGIGSNQADHLGKGDITLDMSGWKQFAVHFDSMYQADLYSGKMKPGAAIISDYWFPAAHLDHYYGIPFRHNLLAFGPINDIHHFAWLNWRRPRLGRGSDAYFIYPSNYYGPPNGKLRNEFASVEDSLLIPQYRNANIVRYFVIYRMHDFRGDSNDYLIQGIQ
jgi:Dolichyl-phosphate-mannose-protein mannosyltransferase